MLALYLILAGFHGVAVGVALAGPPIVTVDSANFTGVYDGNLSKFLGIPFATPPLGRLRFRKAQPLPPYNQPLNATAYGPSCIQQRVTPPSNLPSNISALIAHSPQLHEVSGPQSEDCLSVNVVKPSWATNQDSFPVIVWIYGGGFQTGGSAEHDKLATRIVERSIELYQPVVFVSMNYRVSALGFLPGIQMSDEKEGNLGLLDQRLALGWVQRHIQSFGGDRTQVMLWGESSGAISVSMQMLAYGGTAEGQFNAAFMQSGAPIPAGDMAAGQKYFDFLVGNLGCKFEIDKLECLRHVPLDDLMKVVDGMPNYFSYESLALVWGPREDGILLYGNPTALVQAGSIAPLPFVSGNCEDEGTIFALSSRNVTTDIGFRDYIDSVWFPNATTAELDPLWTYYTTDLAAGSPSDTADTDALTPQFKRIAAFQGDLFFQAPRRQFLQQASGKMKTWSYLSKRAKSTRYLGSYHGSDFDTNLMDDYVINMAFNHDPNNGTGHTWPQYTSQSPSAYTFGSSATAKPIISQDTYRSAAFEYLTNISIAHPFEL